MDAVSTVSESFESFLTQKADLNRIPIGGTFELLPVCNLDCKMCYIRQNQKYVTENGGLKNADFWINIIKDGIEQGLLYVLFTGGEPFLYSEFEKLYSEVSKLPVYIVINTNAVLLDEEKIKWLAEQPPRRLNISLYGASEETYERLCGNGKAYHKVVEAFSLLNKYKIPFQVHTVLVPDNVQDYDKIIEICNKYNVSLQMTNYMFPPYRKNNIIDYQKHRLHPSDAARIGYRYMKDAHGDNFQEYRMKKLHEITFPEESPIYGVECMTCRGGVSSFWIDWRGWMSPCGIMNQQGVDLSNISFESAWEQVKKLHDQVIISSQCATCEKRSVCPICAAAAFCETGDTDGVPEYCCNYCDEFIKLLRETRD